MKPAKMTWDKFMRGHLDTPEDERLDTAEECAAFCSGAWIDQPAEPEQPTRAFDFEE